MSGLERRSERLYEGLTARERAVLELEATKADEAPSPLIRWMMPDAQAGEFNEYMHQLRVLGRLVGAYSLVLEREVENVQSQLVLLSVLVLWGEDRAASAPEVSRRKSRVPQRADGPHAADRILATLAPTPGSLLPRSEWARTDELMQVTAERLRQEVTRLSGVLMAVDAVIAEVAQALGGHDPVHPSIRESLDATRAALNTSREQVSVFAGPLSPPERDAPSYALLRGLLTGEVD